MITGSIVALVTPMQADGSVDWAGLERLLDMHMEAGTAAIGAVGTTGESATLSVPEHCEVIKHCVQHVAGRIPLVAGTGSNSTREAIELTSAAAAAGADACLLVTPYYNKPTQEGLYLHFKAVAEAVDIPQILYNVPGRTAVDMLPETVARLAVTENIVGLKEATGDLDRIRRLREVTPADFAIYSGDDATAREAILLGANGDISVTANVAPGAMHAMCAAALAGDAAGAAEIDARLAGLHKDLFLESNPIPVKWAVAEMGLIGRGIRLPLTWFSASLHDRLREAMRGAGVV